MIQSLKLIWKILTPRDKYILFWMFWLNVLLAGTQASGVFSILPFVGMIVDAQYALEHPMIHEVYKFLGEPEQSDFMLILGLGMFVLFTLTSVFFVLAAYATTRFVENLRVRLSQRLLNIYISRPYAFHLEHNSSNFIQTLLQRVTLFSTGGVGQMISFFSNFIISTLLLAVVFIPHPQIAFMALLSIGLLYGGTYVYTRREAYNTGDRIRVRQSAQLKSASELMGGIKEILALGRVDTFIDQFVNPSRQIARDSIKLTLLINIPTALIQIIGIGGILCVFYFYVFYRYQTFQIMPMMSFYIAAASRLMPSVQGLFKTCMKVQNSLPAAESVYEVLSMQEKARVEEDIEPITFKNSIDVRGVSFTFNQAGRSIITDVSMRINKGDCVAFIGETGCGKTTMADLIAGLLKPDSGEILVDAAPMPRRDTVWGEKLGYVTQHVFLCDDSVAANIALGVASDFIDMKRVRFAAEVAMASEFIESELSEGYDTMIGERGVRLSGGQRQRLGIARAIYHDPDLLIFDEASSALDVQTEARVMDNIRQRVGDKTIIMIAHRLSTIRACDRIYYFDQGKLLESGSYQHLLDHSESFKVFVSHQH